jgi:hypothetical protein
MMIAQTPSADKAKDLLPAMDSVSPRQALAGSTTKSGSRDPTPRPYPAQRVRPGQQHDAAVEAAVHRLLQSIAVTLRDSFEPFWAHLVGSTTQPDPACGGGRGRGVGGGSEERCTYSHFNIYGN